MSVADRLVRAAKKLGREAGALEFGPPVSYVYNPLEYAGKAHMSYLRRFGTTEKRVLFLGMNPGPFGMAQTGVPFGEVSVARGWIGVHAKVGRPGREHPKRPVEGFDCKRSEVSGRRLWGLFEERFGSAEAFFAEHFVSNYCPLLFLEESGRNLTPDKLAKKEVERLFAICDDHLRKMTEILRPRFVAGVGAFAQKQAARALAGMEVELLQILHPSPASPAANKGWAGKATEQLKAAGVWG